MSGQSEILTFNYPNMVVRVHQPDISEEEHKRRMKQIYKAAEELLKEKIGGKRETNTG
jgi:hypothetical protein